MLTNKQRWRRASDKTSLRAKCSQIRYHESLSRNDPLTSYDKFLRRSSAPSIGSKKIPNCCPRRRTTGDLSNASIQEDNGKPHVHFSEVSRVVLVPSRKDYYSRGLDKDLWWSSGDYTQFKSSAKEEVQQLLKQSEFSDYGVKSAIHALYQPVQCCTSSQQPIHKQPHNREYVRQSSRDSTDSQVSVDSVDSGINFMDVHPKPYSHNSSDDKRKPAPQVTHPLALMVY
mmetsp:Transcript_14467/g.21754  ORF Transcript_14467/g.21754 Transcript_14467/m.21754 type:complete len:228 (+) Transcript_14467:280-963(+)|eukprot:CAMPEP_0185031056 /NCGR_PEP_ID=MMETSP1103-20130426/18296_1 /TAXON_ID=36769 /ORGANISM="Paraphysomonas bandaiensis, Strain Caron Lab Isolate" /LENGTH=227 /DNA_ID=CAMNT_0027566421 /DNA_START=209 /DNA_END=892 /DNA_ORIENTATION=+